MPETTPSPNSLRMRLLKCAAHILERLPYTPSKPVEARTDNDVTELILIARPVGSRSGVESMPSGYYSPLEQLIIKAIGDKSVKQINVARKVHEIGKDGKATPALRFVMKNLIDRRNIEVAEDDSYRLTSDTISSVRSWGILDEPTTSED